mmetsp:Transcript_34619/g.63278  ORF Transcript_34619/g.63278 Transcript_34619/m.63278 type:complete len:246 (-) Transcript_34619:562-1299(-)
MCPAQRDVRKGISSEFQEPCHRLNSVVQMAHVQGLHLELPPSPLGAAVVALSGGHLLAILYLASIGQVKQASLELQAMWQPHHAHWLQHVVLCPLHSAWAMMCSLSATVAAPASTSPGTGPSQTTPSSKARLPLSHQMRASPRLTSVALSSQPQPSQAGKCEHQCVAAPRRMPPDREVLVTRSLQPLDPTRHYVSMSRAAAWTRLTYQKQAWDCPAASKLPSLHWLAPLHSDSTCLHKTVRDSHP